MHRLAQLQPVAAKCCGNSSHHSLWQPAKRQQQQNTVQQQQQHRSTSMTKYFDHLSFPSCPSTVVAAATHSRTTANTCMIPARYLASSTAHGQSLEQPQPPPTAACQFASCCTVSSHNVKSERHGSNSSYSNSSGHTLHGIQGRTAAYSTRSKPGMARTAAATVHAHTSTGKQHTAALMTALGASASSPITADSCLSS